MCVCVYKMYKYLTMGIVLSVSRVKNKYERRTTVIFETNCGKLIRDYYLRMVKLDNIILHNVTIIF